jgi:ribulose-phosphate 3-epimerase
VPTIIAKTQSELDAMITRLEGKTNRVMLDFMDGRFVPNTSLDFDFQISPRFEYEAHLMVENPSGYMEGLRGRAEWAILHYETLRSPDAEIRSFKKEGFKVSLAANPETPVEAILSYLELLDGVLILTVNPGQHGGKFIPETLRKIERLREMGVALPIEVDGGVNPDTIPRIRDAGANVFACGSYLMKYGDVSEGMQSLRKALGA